MTEPSALRSRVLWGAGRPVIRTLGRLGFSLAIEYQADLPEAPYVIAANHYSHFDPPAVGVAAGIPVRFLALDDLFGVHKLLDWLITGYGVIPIPRTRRPIRAVRAALTALEAGEVVGVFPEATRVSHWGTMPPKRGAAWLASRARVPLVPVAVIGTGIGFGLENRIRRTKIRVIVGAPIDPSVGDVDELTALWAEWISEQIDGHPDSEVKGPPRAHFAG